jgi:hypothetical protein
MRRETVLACSFLMLACCQAAAQQFVAPKTPIPIYASPPGTGFQGKGREINKALPNQRFEVLTRLEVPTLLGAEVWLRVRLVGNSTATDGWIFAGPLSSPEKNISPM